MDESESLSHTKRECKSHAIAIGMCLPVRRLALVPDRYEVDRRGTPKVENPEFAKQPLARLQAAARTQWREACEPVPLRIALGDGKACRPADLGLRAQQAWQLIFNQFDQPQRARTRVWMQVTQVFVVIE